MDVAINRGTHRVPESYWRETFNFVSNKIASLFSSIKVSGYKLMGIMGVCFARLKIVILGEPKAGAQEVKPLREEAPVAPQKKSPVASQEKSPGAPQFVQLREESPVIPKFILYMRSRWLPTRDRLNAMRESLENFFRRMNNANTNPVLFERDLDARFSTIMMVISVLEEKTNLIDRQLWSRCSESIIDDNEKNRTKIYRAITAMEQACKLLDGIYS